MMAPYKESIFLSGLVRLLYSINNHFTRKALGKWMIKRKGYTGGFYSKTLHKLFLKYHGVKVGMYSRGAFWSNLPPGTTVGNFSSLSKGLLVINGSHPVRHKSTHAFFFNPDLGYVDRLLIERRKQLDIGHDVYIGLNVTIMPNVTSIGTGAVVAACSVLTRDVPPYAIVGGNPAKLIKYRFSEETIQKLLASKWWEKNIEEILADDREFKSFLQPLEQPELQVKND
jgi:virginiamycin A acetyltransferase